VTPSNSFRSRVSLRCCRLLSSTPASSVGSIKQIDALRTVQGGSASATVVALADAYSDADSFKTLTFKITFYIYTSLSQSFVDVVIFGK
jgi:hypothetical protein